MTRIPFDDRFSAWVGSASQLLSAYREMSGSTSTHGDLLGKAREVFVSELLQRFLPQALHIGSGQVIDGEGQVSKQIDILIYRHDVPLLPSFGGSNLYFAEGVVSSIEVKSELNASRLREALDNCSSIKKLTVEVPDKAPAATYVFGYSGYTRRLSAIKNIIFRWIEDRSIDTLLHLPEVIVTKGCVVVKNDNRLLDFNGLRQKLGYHAVFLAATEEVPLRWLLLHLLKQVGSESRYGYGLASRTIDQLLRRGHVAREALEDRAEFWGKWDGDFDRRQIVSLD